MTLLFKNNATSRLAINTDAASPTLTVLVNEGEKFPNPAPGDYFAVTIEDRRTNQLEVCRCTARSGDVLTVQRGQEDTFAQPFSQYATVSHRPTAGTFQDLLDIVINASGYTKSEADDRFINRDGDMMSGALSVLPPISNDDATTKLYVDTTTATKVHTHVMADVTDLQPALDAKAPMGPNDGAVYVWKELGWASSSEMTFPWDRIVGAPATYPPSPHTHPTSDVINLDTALGSLNTQILDLQANKTSEAPADGKQYARQDTAWVPVTSAVYVGSDPPADPADNALFWDCDNGSMYIRYDDGDSAQWVRCNAQGLGDAPLDAKTYGRSNQAWVEIASGIPDAPLGGSFYGRKSNAWVIPGIADITNLQTTLNAKFNTAGGTITGGVAMNAGLTVNAVSGTYSGVFNNNSTLGGGVVGFGSSASAYGICGYGAWGFYGTAGYIGGVTLSGNDITSPGSLNVQQYVTTARGGSEVQTSSANTVMTTNGTIRRTTSSMYFKNQIEKLAPEYADLVLKLKTVFYRPGENVNEPKDWSRFGFIAEDAFGVDFRFADCEPEEPTKPIIHDLNAIVACLLDVVRRQGDRIAALEAR